MSKINVSAIRLTFTNFAAKETHADCNQIHIKAFGLGVAGTNLLLQSSHLSNFAQLLPPHSYLLTVRN